MIDIAYVVFISDPYNVVSNIQLTGINEDYVEYFNIIPISNVYEYFTIEYSSILNIELTYQIDNNHYCISKIIYPMLDLVYYLIDLGEYYYLYLRINNFCNQVKNFIIQIKDGEELIYEYEVEFYYEFMVNDLYLEKEKEFLIDFIVTYEDDYIEHYLYYYSTYKE